MTDTHKYHFFVDTKKYETDKPSLTGAEIKAMIPGFNPTYQLYIEEPGDKPDRPVADTEPFSLAEGEHHGVRKFYTVPPATFGGR
jgi:Multiubiquitin